jgi:tetratricopeptide (TPR) repeat protein
MERTMSAINKSFRILPVVVLGIVLNAGICFAGQTEAYTNGLRDMQLNDLQKAIYSFDQAVTNDGTDWRSFLRRGQCLYQLGDYKLAIADFNQVITAKPRNTDALLWRANCYAKLGQADKATNDYKQLLSFDPIKLAVVSQRAVFTSGRQNLADTDDDFSTSLASQSTPSSLSSAAAASAASSTADTIKPASTEALHLRASLFASSSDPSKEISQLSSAISLDPKNPKLLFQRARAYIQLRKNDNAVTDLSDALMNNPNNASYYLARALVYHLIGNDVLASEDIRQAQFCDPGLPKTIDFENSNKKSALPMLNSIIG